MRFFTVFGSGTFKKSRKRSSGPTSPHSSSSGFISQESSTVKSSSTPAHHMVWA